MLFFASGNTLRYIVNINGAMVVSPYLDDLTQSRALHAITTLIIAIKYELTFTKKNKRKTSRDCLNKGAIYH